MELRGQLVDRNVSISTNYRFYHVDHNQWCTTAQGIGGLQFKDQSPLVVILKQEWDSSHSSSKRCRQG
jgi:hypothetical protein